MTQPNSIRDAMVGEYLSDLEAALAGADPVERAETLGSIREHLELSLPADAPRDKVAQTLADLGKPWVIAKSETPAAPAAMVSTAVVDAIAARPDGISIGLLVASIVALLGARSGIPALMVACVCVVGASIDLATKRGHKGVALVSLGISLAAVAFNPFTFLSVVMLLDKISI